MPLSWSYLQNYPEQFVTTRAALAVAEQRAYAVTTGKVTLTLAGNFRISIRNPPTSGRKLVLMRVVGVNSASAMAWGDVYVQPTTGLPATALLTPTNAVIVAADDNLSSVAEVRHDVDATVPVGGGRLALSLAVPTGRHVYDLTLVVTPGVTMGINVAFAGAADAALTGYWYEEPL